MHSQIETETVVLPVFLNSPNFLSTTVIQKDRTARSPEGSEIVRDLSLLIYKRFSGGKDILLTFFL